MIEIGSGPQVYIVNMLFVKIRRLRTVRPYRYGLRVRTATDR